jgi:hypothetical protein
MPDAGPGLGVDTATTRAADSEVGGACGATHWAASGDPGTGCAAHACPAESNRFPLAGPATDRVPQRLLGLRAAEGLGSSASPTRRPLLPWKPPESRSAPDARHATWSGRREIRDAPVAQLQAPAWRSLLLEPVGIELQRSRVLGDRPHDRVARTVREIGLDLDCDLHVRPGQAGQVLHYSLSDLCCVPGQA